MFEDSDYVDSDDLDAILEMSRKEHEAVTSRTNNRYETPMLAKKHQLKECIAQFDAEIKGYEDEIKSIMALIALRKEERHRILLELESITPYAGKGKNKEKEGIDYGREEFEWSGGLKAKMKSVFGISDFRLCQRGVCNANMDGRDIVCIMPTGGGKSLTYQVPALLQPGCTLVISPLISLITDQILHLQEAGVQAVKLTGGTTKEEANRISKRLMEMANRKVSSKDDEIKLCYVTPEKMSKSKSFLSLVQKLVAGSQLARFVIDEAHCVSQSGHDFRPDYEKLRTLRQLFPDVPIMALTATCPPKVLQNLIQTLGLRPVTDGNNADTQGTAYFSSPLYRKNLHYSVQPKSDKASDVLKTMARYILDRHAKDSGIVYCLTKKDAENVAEGLKKCSEGKILTGVYHADRHDREKEGLHVAWRKGTVKVVCATIAFGLGIDKGDKSVEGYYQESGRAGRDGKDSDCVLYYRPQDGATIGSMVAHEKEGKDKLHAMLSFAQDLNQCRKFQFAKYFSHSSELAMSSWSADGADALTPCGHCDNCTRPAGEVQRKDVTLETWQLLKIADYVTQDGASLTLKMLASLARGSGGAAYEVVRGGSKTGKGKEKEKVSLDLDAVAGGAVGLTQEEIEYLLVEMLMKKYLQESYHQTAYHTLVYLIRGPLAPRLTRLTREDLEAAADGLKVECMFRKRVRGGGSRNGKAVAKARAGPSQDAQGELGGKMMKGQVLKPPSCSSAGKKRKRDVPEEEEDNEVVIGPRDDDEIEDSEEDEDFMPVMRPPPVGRRGGSSGSSSSGGGGDDEDSDFADGGGWSHSMRTTAKMSSPARKKRRSSPGVQRAAGGGGAARVVTENDQEVWVLSSD